MPSFAYVAKDRTGRTIKGVVDAPNQKEAADKLRKDNLFITSLVSTDKAVSGKKALVSEKGRVTLKDKLFFTRQFNVMLRAGLSMIVILNNLFSQGNNKFLKYVINEISKGVEGGESLSVAMGRYPKAFDKMFVHMMEAGEASGKLDVSLERMSEYYQKEYELRKKVTAALVYPVIITVVAVIVVTILMIVVLPMFAQIFRDAGVQLPLITQLLINFGEFGKRFWFLLPLIPALVFFVYRAMRANPKGSEMLDKFWLKVPLIGDLLLKVAVSRFTRTFSTLLDSGVPLLQGLDIVEKVVGNAVLAKAIRDAAISVNRGSGLATPLENSGIFPPMVSQMVAIGEETGNITAMLEQVSEYYDKEVGYAVENLTTMIEPLIIVVLGGVVAFIVAAIMIPMFDMSSGATLR